MSSKIDDDSGDMSTVPPGVLHAAAERSAKIVLVLGAGCSYPSPTHVPMARECSEKAYARLLLDKVLADGDCHDPTDLSVLADTVYEKRNQRQSELVERLPLDRFRRARYNDGYLIAAALLRENVVSSILTLNYDLAIEHALTELSAFEVQPIAAPEHVAQMKAHNVVYLHRNVNEPNFESWVLRASAIEHEWKIGWESAMAQCLLTSPVVIFAGLGSRAQVLVETIGRIRSLLDKVAAYQVDPSSLDTNEFAAALALPEGSYIRLGWNEFMAILALRVSQADLADMRQSCSTHIANEGLQVRTLDPIFAELGKLGIVELGMLRAEWILDKSEPYTPHDRHVSAMLADLIIAADVAKEKTQATEARFDRGVVEFRNDMGAIAATMFATGKGQRSWVKVDQDIRQRVSSMKGRATPPTVAFISGATGQPLDQMVAPENVAFEELPRDDVINGPSAICLVNTRDFLNNPDIIDALL